MTPPTELQRFVLPDGSGWGAEESYIRKSGGHYSHELRAFRFIADSEFNSLTFYNAFPVSRWRKNTSVESLSLRFKGEGQVIIQILLARLDTIVTENLPDENPSGGQEVVKTMLKEIHVTLDRENYLDCDIEDYRALQPGLIYFNMIPLENGYLSEAGFFTHSPPAQTVKLGLVITHYNRQQEVQSTATRIRHELLEENQFKQKITLTIVDNSKNSNVREWNNVTVLENENYGGSGGFSRGLLHLTNPGSYTHCLFMDDDASCEIESLRRAYKFMMFSTTPNMAIAGTLLNCHAPNLIYEKGAVFDGLCRRIHPDLDMGSEEELIYCEDETIKANYGGWWFFGFKLSDIRYFPFPFFVRGDDTSFSLMNKLNIATMIGIASYGETFESKNGVLTSYLDARSHLVQQIAILDHGRIKVLTGFARFFLKALLSYEYATARAVCMAAEDMSLGVDFFVDNLDMSSRLPVLRDMGDTQSRRDIELAEMDKPGAGSESPIHKAARIITFNGTLLPGFMLKNRTVIQSKGFRADFRQVFRYRRICYQVSGGESVHLVTLDRKKMFAGIAVFIPIFVRIAFQYGKIRSTYISKMPKVMSREFWSNIYP